MPDPTKIPSPSDILGNNSIPSPSDILGDGEKKKSISTSTPPKSVSGTPTGSSGGVNPAFKNTTPSPIPDFNSMPKSKESPIKVEDETSFLEDVVSTVKSKVNKLATGSAQLGADYASTPELLYDAFAMPQNAIADYFDLPSLHTDSEKFKKTVGVKNSVKEYYQGEVAKLREHAKKVDTQYQQGIYDSFKNGDVLGGFDQLTNSFSESLPATASIMLGGAYAKAPQLLATSSMVFGAGKNEQLKDENPDMNTNARVVNALATGLAEGAFETIGSGSIGAAARGIIEREGVKKGAIILKDGLTNVYKATIAKNPFLASVGVEGGTEWATKVTQNSIDVATGVKPQDFNVFDGATDALIGGIFGGTVFGAGLKGLENVANSKDKTTIKSNVDKTFELQKALENPDISEATKVEIEKGIEKLVKTNQDLVKKNVEHADNLHPKVKEKLVEAVTKSDEIKESVKAIKLDNGTNDFQKQILLDGLKDDFKKHIQLKGEILDGKTTPVDVLPLKEQDKIKRQALKELTAEQNPDGKKSIEIDNAQIVERANKIYKENEQTPTPEAQPQAEVPQQAEAEKVVTPPVEDVVATSVENIQNNGLKISGVTSIEFEDNNETILYGTKNNRTRISIKGMSKEQIQEEYDFDKQVFDKNKNRDFEAEEIEIKKSIGLTDNEKISALKELKSSKRYNDILENITLPFYETKLNEKLQAGDITPNASIRPTASNVGESGNTKQESPVQESVSSSVDGGEVKGDASVGEFAEFEKVVNESKSVDEAFDKIKNIQGVSSETSKSFREKYDPKGELSTKEAFGKFYNDVKSKNDGKQIEPHSEVNTDVETVKKELNLNEVDNLLYDELKDTPADKVFDKIDKIKDDKLGEIETIEKKMDDVDLKMEDNGDAIDKIDEDETLSAAKKKKAIAVLEKEYKDLQKQRENLESEKEGIEKLITDIDDALFHPTEDYNADKVSELINKVNTRLETRKSVKEGTNLFPEDANIPEFVAIKKELIKLTDEKTIADFNSRTAEQVKESEPIIADIKSKAKNAERISKEELEKGIADAEKLITEAKNGAEELERLSTDDIKDLEYKSKNNTTQVPEGKGSWRKAFNEEKDAFKKSAILRRVAEKTTSKSDLLDIKEASKGMPEESNILNEVNNKLKSIKPTTKERIAERIKLSDAKVDDIKAHIKGIDNIFGIKIKIDDVEGLNKNGIDFVDVIASIAKQAIAAGIHIDEAINKTIEHFKGKYDFDVNIDEIKERINPKKEAGKDFKSKSGKKSLLGRLVEGGNPDVITKAVKELGENYDVRNQEEANEEAMAFIDKVGASEALKAIRDGLITNSDVKMLIYDEALTRLKTEISDEMDNNPEDREALIQKFQEVSDDFDKAIRDSGQGIAIMNFIYNKNQTLKYNLKKQIADWKRNDPNNEIPDDIKAKYEELDQKLKDLEEKTKDAEIRAKKAEDELAVKNIQEDVAREKKAAKTNKTKAKELANIIRTAKIHRPGIFSSATPASLVWDGAVEVVAKSVETGGTIADAIENGLKYIKNTNWYKGLSDTDKQEAEDTFKSDLSKSSRPANITIGKDKKIKIPAQLLRDYVEQGYTDIDEIAALIKDDIADEFPDVDVRDIRDALTGYGKQINPNKDEITAQVNKLKEYGRLLSAYDDVMNGEMPKKSGLVRPKSEQKARELRRNINRLAKELNLEPVDLERQWANAIDKVKSHLKNQIEDLNKQIANGEKRKVDRTPIKLDEEATALKTIRDAKKQILDDLAGKPELTEEQKIANVEKSLDNSIKKLQEEIDTNDIAFKEKPTAVTSAKIEQLKVAKKALLETKKQLRQEAGLIEQQRLKTTKTRIKNQIEDLNTRIKNKDFAKKEVKPILADNELNTLRAEKEAVYEEYEKMKYLQELKNRTLAKKIMDESLEALGLARAVKASLDLGLIGIQLRGFTYSELWRNPKELARKFIKMFGSIGSQNKTNKAMSELIGHPLHALAKKLDIGMTHPDLRNEVREEMASGNLLHFIWSSPILAAEALGGKEAMNSKRTSIGDSFIDSVKKQYNKLFQNYQVDIKQKEKFSVKEQWKNINAFEAVERGLSVYGNQLRFEEFVRGVDRLKAEGKDEINHLEDYKALASYIRTFSGRAKPAGFELNQKALNVFFFSFKNMASVIQQLNPIYYGLQHTRSTDFKNGNYFKPTVANKMAMATMFKSVVSTSATLLFVMAAYNAFKDDDEEEATIEKDPRSSDFGKLKIGNFRYDPWGGYIPLISLYARLLTEETKNSEGNIVKFGEGFAGIQNRGDAATRFLINKESPGFQMFHKYMTSTEEVDKATGKTYRATPFGGKLSEEDAYSFYPIFLGSVKSAKEKDYEGVQAFLTAYSILGLGNVQEYESKKGNTLEEKFIEKQKDIKEYNALPQVEKDKVDSNAKIPSLRGAITEQENMKYAIKTKTPYYVKGDSEPIDLSDITIAEIDETIADLKNSIEEMKKEAGDKYTEPKN